VMPEGHLAFGVPDEAIRNQLRTIQAVDDGVGRILASLEKTGQLDSTIIVYTSDNGYFWNEHHLGDKRAAYDEGLRDPFLVRYPKLIKAGTRPTEMALNIDVAPTFLELAGVAVPKEMQGKSLVPVLKGNAPGWRQSAMFEYFLEKQYPNIPTYHAVRDQRWKYIRYDEWPGMDELYDLKSDPYELKNLFKEPAQAGKVAEMKKELARLEDETK
jgi:N-acetylglucosamine-6-sulfatase